jgi:hypothetical protein
MPRTRLLYVARIGSIHLQAQGTELCEVKKEIPSLPDRGDYNKTIFKFDHFKKLDKRNTLQ